MMAALAPLADYAVASPAYLHLSYLDTRSLGNLSVADSAPGRKDWRRLADTVAAQSFARLKTNTLTEITVAVYDLEKTAAFTSSTVGRKTPRSGDTTWRDCAARSGFDANRAGRGVTLLYRAPRFGPGKNVAARSGWQCPD
jgi:hypothetical protein